MSKKYVTIHDLDNFKVHSGEGGMYAILPYERLNKQGKGVFKVGQADDYKKRFESYHTYYPLGFYYKNLLTEPRLNKRDTPREKITVRKQYNRIEHSIHEDIVKHGGKQLLSTTRVKNAGKYDNVGGETEWFYANEKAVDDAFKHAYKTYGGRLHSDDLSGINKQANQNKKGSDYNAEIYYKFK
jgi:hypothetical protein